MQTFVVQEYKTFTSHDPASSPVPSPNPVQSRLSIQPKYSGWRGPSPTTLDAGTDIIVHVDQRLSALVCVAEEPGKTPYSINQEGAMMTPFVPSGQLTRAKGREEERVLWGIPSV